MHKYIIIAFISICCFMLAPAEAQGESFDTDLEQGWNLISIPLQPTDTSVDSVFSSIAGQYRDAWGYNIFDTNDPWKHYHPSHTSFSDLSNIQLNNGYWVYLNQNATLTVSGDTVTANQPVSLKTGWTLIGWPFLYSQSISEALSPLVLGVHYDQVTRFNPVTQTEENYSGQPSDDFNTFEPGKGYYIHVLTDCSATFVPDTTPPPIPTVNPYTTPTNVDTQTLSGTKGVDSSIWINGVEEVSIDELTTWSVQVALVEGDNLLSITSRDAAGNESAANTITIVLDTGDPTGTIIINGGDEYTNNTQVTLTLTATGADYMFIDGDVENDANVRTWIDYVDETAATLTSGDGTKAVSVLYRDEAGNPSALASDSIILATTEFVQPLEDRLILKDSQTPFYFSSTNQYYLFYKPLPMVDEVFEDAAAMGISAIRTWAFCDGEYEEGVSFQPSPGVYDETGFARMDYLIKKAKEMNMRLILVLVNNWTDFGGMNAYVNWSATASTHDDFYTDANCRQWYKDYVSYMLNRVNTLTGVAYKDDPTILIWELGNEPRCSSDPSGDTLQAWIEEMSAHIKSIDTNHMVSTGSEGWYSDGSRLGWNAEGVDYIRNHQSPNIDICTFHLFEGRMGFTGDENHARWIQEHIDEAHFVINKPVYCSEVGVRVYRTASDAAAQMDRRNAIYTEWFGIYLDRLSESGGFWLLSADSYPDYDNYTVYYPGDSDTADIISNYSNEMSQLRGLTYFKPLIYTQDKNVNEGETLEFQVDVSNPGGLSLTFSSPNLPPGATLSTGGYFQWALAEVGVYNNVEIIATYNSAQSSVFIDINVADADGNNTPQINYDEIITMDKNTQIDNAIDLWAVTTDDETLPENLIYTIGDFTSSDVIVTLDTNRYIDISATNDFVGDASFTAYATDERGLTGSKQIAIRVMSNETIAVPADYPTISDAASVAQLGDTILVSPGTYSGGINLADAVTLISASGPEVTIIDASGSSYGIRYYLSIQVGNRVEGFTIKNATGHGTYGITNIINNIIENNGSNGIYLSGQSTSLNPLIEKNIIRNNGGRGISGGSYSATVYNNIINNNAGGGIYFSNGSQEIINNTIVNNTANRGGGIYILYSSAKVYNNIITNNHAIQYGGGVKGWQNDPEFDLDYNDVWNNTADLGETNYGTVVVGPNNISVDPLFVDYIGGDFHLQVGLSPCIDAGNPVSDYSNEPEPNGGRINMGAYGNTQEATVTDILPVAIIDSISPNPAALGEDVTFTGHGTDVDGTITGYRWESDIDAELGTSATIIVSNISEGTHTISFFVKDNHDAWSDPITDTLVIDGTEPTVFTVTDEGEFTSNNAQLSASWTESTDTGSGIKEYQYAVGTTQGDNDVADWASNGLSTAVDIPIAEPYLQHGPTYYISVRAYDNANNSSEASSDGIAFDSPPEIISFNVNLEPSFHQNTEVALDADASDADDDPKEYKYMVGAVVIRDYDSNPSSIWNPFIDYVRETTLQVYVRAFGVEVGPVEKQVYIFRAPVEPE